MARDTIRKSTIEHSLEKAGRIKPVILEVDPNFWAVASSTPGKAYLVERDPETGDLWCPCPGFAHTGYCYHKAAVGLMLGTIPEAWVPAPASTYMYEVAS